MPLVSVAITDLAQEPIRKSDAHLDPERVAYYMDHLDDSTPVVIYDVAGQLILADGYHRVAAARQLGRVFISADVRKGTPADALRFAAELAQQQRGLPREQVMAAIMRRADCPEDSH
jgi:hypothetical protein